MSDIGGIQDAIREAADPGDVLQRIADGVLQLLPAAEGAVIELIDDEGLLNCVCTAGNLVRFTGLRLPQDGSLSGMAFRTGEVLRSEDAGVDPRVNHDAVLRTGITSMVCIPLVHGLASVGVLQLSSSRRAAFGDIDVDLLSELASFVSVVVGNASDVARMMTTMLGDSTNGARAPEVSAVGESSRHVLPAAAKAAAVAAFVADVLRPGVVEKVESRERIERALAATEFTIVFQPVVDLHSGQISSVEALARFDGPPVLPPDRWFADADAVGLGVDLELAAIEAALPALHRLPDGVRLAINVGPKAVGHPRLHKLLAEAGPDRIIVELTEHIRIDDYEQLKADLLELRRLGVRLSIDDTGAGYASLTHILNLGPDYIKLDLGLTRGIETDPVRRALASALCKFAGESGAKVVAEGIETAAALSTLRSLGADYGQGYYLGRPGSLDALTFDVPVPLLHEADPAEVVDPTMVMEVERRAG